MNQAAIISCLQSNNGLISRAALAKQVGLSRTTISSTINRLIELDLVKETDNILCDKERGRPGIPICLTDDVWYAAGATLLDNEVFFALLKLDGSIANSFSLPVPDRSSKSFLSILKIGFEQLIAVCPGRFSLDADSG